MKNSISDELVRIVAAVEVLSPERFRIGESRFDLGGPGPLFPPSDRRHAVPVPSSARPSAAAPTPEPAPTATLGRALTEQLYSRWYLRCAAESAPAPDLVAHRDHLAALSLANTCTGTWEPGWRVVGVEPETQDRPARIAVEGYGATFAVSPTEIRPTSPSPAPGTACRVRIPGEMRTLRPGFYTAVGDADPSPSEEVPYRVRLYWHLLASGAAQWVRWITAGLNDEGIPFRLKVIADPRFYLRADAGVLVLEPQHLDAARGVVLGVYRDIRGHLRPSIPALTLELAPGLGLAEGSSDAASFGAGRCALIADALLGATLGALTKKRADSDSPPNAGPRSKAVVESFLSAGLDPERPYRSPGSNREYRALVENESAFRFEKRPSVIESGGSPVHSIQASEGEAEPAPEGALLNAASRIGDALCRDAFRCDDRCNWLGRAFVPASQAGRELQPALGALGPTLYGGTAGIALFLAELFRRTAEPAHRETARAAIRQALTAIEREGGRIRPVAFYEGELGVAWAARRVATLIGSDEFDARANALLLSIVDRLPGDRRMDVLEGNAGAICSLIGLNEKTGDTRFLQAAGTLGQELLAATLDTLGPTAGRQAPLTGLAHGAAGIGLALLELWAATGDAAFQIAANRYFTYEDRCFESGQENWPDFRGVPVDQAGRPVRNPGCMTAWCHGAPGIALSRLRAIEIDPMRAARYEPAARAGLRTTVRAIESSLAETDADPCLCHGLAGLAEVAETGARVLDDPKVEKTATSAIERLTLLFEQRLKGTLDSVRPYDPSLLTGEAGVGYTLLRFGDPERVATVLLPRSLEAAAREQRSRRPEGFEHKGKGSVEYGLEGNTV